MTKNNNNTEKSYKEKIDEAKFILQNNLEWINNCDTKASIVLTLIGVVLAIVFTSETLKIIISVIKASISNWQMCDAFFILIFSILLIILVLGIYYLYLALKADIDYNTYKQEGLSKDSIIFFGKIAEKENF